MRIEVARNLLARLLQQVSKVVEARNTIPVLSCIRLVNADGVLTATASDLDVTITGSIASPGEDAAFCVNAKMITDVIGKMSSDDVLLDVKGGAVTITGGRSRFKLQTLPADDFPNFTGPAFTTELAIDLAALVAPVQFSTSTEETRYYLNGVYFLGDGRNITAVATDGHRLSRNIIDSPAEFAGAILPRKIVTMLPKGEIKVELSATQVRVTGADTVITSKLIDGTYPDFGRVIPSGNEKRIGVDRDVIMRAADRVSVVSSERGRAVKISIAGGQAILSVRGDGDEATDEIAVEYDGEPVEIGFNSKYVAEVFSVFPAGIVRLALHDSGSPALLSCDAAPGLNVVLMPMRV